MVLFITFNLPVKLVMRPAYRAYRRASSTRIKQLEKLDGVKNYQVSHIRADRSENVIIPLLHTSGRE